MNEARQLARWFGWRCAHRYSGFTPHYARCLRVANHDGHHQEPGGWRWTLERPPAPPSLPLDNELPGSFSRPAMFDRHNKEGLS